jgi:hypothetical protein
MRLSGVLIDDGTIKTADAPFTILIVASNYTRRLPAQLISFTSEPTAFCALTRSLIKFPSLPRRIKPRTPREERSPFRYRRFSPPGQKIN